MIDELDLNESQAERLIEKGIEFGVFTDDMPETKKGKIEEAHDIVSFAVDTWVNEGVRPDSDDDSDAAAAKQIEDIFELSGVTMKGRKKDQVHYGEVPDADDSNGDDSGEAPFDIEDAIEGYPDLSAASRIKKIKALELDVDDDDDYNTLIGIEQWENAQEEPSSRVLNYLDDILPPPDGDGDDDQTADDAGDVDGSAEDAPWTEKSLNALEKDDLKPVAAEFDVEFPKRFTDAGRKRVVKAILEAQAAASDDADEGPSGEADEEPWEGYLESDIDDIIKILDDDDRTVDELRYVLEYEQGAEDPDDSILEKCEERIKELTEKAEKPKGRGRRRGAATKDPDDSNDVDDAVARDDAKEEKKSRGRRGAAKKESKEPASYVVVIDDNEVECELLNRTFDIVVEAFVAGAESVTITKG